MRLMKICFSRKRWAHGGDGARERMWARENIPRKKVGLRKEMGLRKRNILGDIGY